MKKVIDGKLYNTETAEEVADWSNSFGTTDFKSVFGNALPYQERRMVYLR